MVDLIGHTLGSYEIIERIGVGGMATVYKAYQASMDRFVAVKVLPQQLAQDPEFIGRFSQEARTIARLENKHILPVYDYGEQDGYTYLVMRYIGTGTLKDLTLQGPLPLQHAIDFLNQIADGLQYAHDQGVIHRDIKTSNVLMGSGDQCYLTDFGIAKLAAGASHFTSSGAIIGTPAYMSPEQCNALPVDVRSDLYSLGIVLYEMLTGRVPFEAETPIAVVRMQIDEPLPSPRGVNPNVPEAVEKVLYRALAKDPANRYDSVHAFADALNGAFDTFTSDATSTFRMPGEGQAAEAGMAARTVSDTRASSVTLPSQGMQRRRTWVLWLGIVIAVSAALIALGSLIADDESDDPTSQPASAEPATTAPEATAVADAGSGTSPGADWVTFTSTRGEAPEDRQLVTTDHGIWMSSGGGLVHWSYDGGYTKYTNADGLYFNDIQAMALATDGTLWLGGGGDAPGVMRITADATGAITDIDYFDTRNSRLQSDWVWAFLPEPGGAMLVGTYESYLERFDGTRWSTPFQDNPQLLATGDRVWTLARTSDNTVWAGGPRGVVRLVDGASQWEVVPLPDELTALGQEGYNVTYLYVDPLDGSLWVFFITEPAWESYVWRLVPPAGDGEDWTWQTADDWLPETVNGILRTSDNALWINGYNIIVRIDDPADDQRQVYDYQSGLVGEPYHGFVEAPDGTLWVATNLALMHYADQRWIAYTIEGEPAANDLHHVAEADDGTLWFLSAYGFVLTYQDGMWDQIEYLDTDLNDIVIQGDVVWIATGSGLVRWQNGSMTWYTADDGLSATQTLSLALDTTDLNRLWVGTIDGLNMVDTATGMITVWNPEINLVNPAVSVLEVDRNGTLWAGTGYDPSQTIETDLGIMQIMPDQRVIVGQTGEPFGPEDHWLTAVEVDTQGQIWVGTDNQLYRYDGENWRKFTDADGVPQWTTYWDILAEDEGIVWFAAAHEGLLRLDSLGWLRVGTRITGSEHHFGLFRASDGALWVLTEDGVARFSTDPVAIQQR